MTTRIHVVNLGPSEIEISTIQHNLPLPGIFGVVKKEKLYPNNYLDFYVFDTQSLIIQEKKPELPTGLLTEMEK